MLMSQVLARLLSQMIVIHGQRPSTNPYIWFYQTGNSWSEVCEKRPVIKSLMKYLHWACICQLHGNCGFINDGVSLLQNKCKASGQTPSNIIMGIAYGSLIIHVMVSLLQGTCKAIRLYILRHYNSCIYKSLPSARQHK